MNPEEFRELALSFPEVEESGDTKRADYGVRGENFATLFSDDRWGVATLPREVQTELVKAQPTVFEPCKGAWGRNGATIVFLLDAEEESVLKALMAAWRKCAPMSLTE